MKMGIGDNKQDRFHGVTVVVNIGDTVHVGKCHRLTTDVVLLQNGDTHIEGEDGLSNDIFLQRTAKLGVWCKHDQIIVPMTDILTITPLKDYYARPGFTTNEAIDITSQSDSEANATPRIETIPNSEGSPVHLTGAAMTEVRRLLTAEDNQGLALRLAVTGGGCSGMVYKVEFDQPHDGDVVVHFEGFDLLLDSKSAIYLRGVSLDYQQGLSGRGFQFNNPNASNTCGCGESFAI